VMSTGYSVPRTVFPTPGLRPPSAGSAETLVLVALILQVIGGAILIGAIAWLFSFSVLYPFPVAWVAVTASVAVGVLVLVFLYFAYTLSYRRIQRGDYLGAQTPTLVIGILSLFAGILPGIFYLVGYMKLGEAIREQRGYVPGYGTPPPATPAVPQVACKGCGRVYPLGQFAFCPSCGQKLGA
jgi:hypothetical protein